MQIVEHTIFGVRSAVLTFEKRASVVRFVLLPMIHLASPEFYEAVQRRLAECDVVVVEGVAGFRARIITLAYRIAGRIRRSGLVEQRRAMDLSRLSGEIIRPDLDAKEFAVGWRAVRFPLRVALYILAPLFGVWMAIVGPDRVLKHNLTVDDEISLEEYEAMEGVAEALVDSRDRSLCAQLVRLAEDGAQRQRTIGVCWGATHMRAVVQTLHGQLGYRVVDAQWLRVL